MKRLTLIFSLCGAGLITCLLWALNRSEADYLASTAFISVQLLTAISCMCALSFGFFGRQKDRRADRAISRIDNFAIFIGIIGAALSLGFRLW